MDCKKLQQKIDELYLEEGTKLDMQEKEHVNDCAECRLYYTAASETNQLLKKIQQWEPILNNPKELTESIMLSISKEEQNGLIDHNKRFKILVRFLTAAVIALFLTLGVEQYMVLNKVQLLEVKMSKVQHDQPTKYLINRASLIDFEQILNVSEPGYTLKNMLALYQLKQIKNADFTFYDLKRYNNKAGNLNSFFSKTSR